jgi:GT2 family glycosyltransferase
VTASDDRARLAPVATVVIATRDRHDSLQRCLQAVTVAANGLEVEVVVIDDGSSIPVTTSHCAGAPVHILQAYGQGRSVARNLGIELARSEIVVFTDDDTVPSVTWLRAVIEYMEEHPDKVGAVGPIESRSWDPLYEHSLTAKGPGHTWTCNVAYRRDALRQVGGFSTSLFPRFREDRDLSMRIGAMGPIGWAPEMRIEHVPRPVDFQHVVRDASKVRSDLLLFALYPELAADLQFGPRLTLIWWNISRWLSAGAGQPVRLSPRRWALALVYALTAGALAIRAAVTTPSLARLRAESSVDRPARPAVA